MRADRPWLLPVSGPPTSDESGLTTWSRSLHAEFALPLARSDSLKRVAPEAGDMLAARRQDRGAVLKAH